MITKYMITVINQLNCYTRRNIINKTFFSALILCILLLPGISQARINIFDTLYPGQDSTIGDINSYQGIATFKHGPNFWEVPLDFTYVPINKTEVGGAWGIKSVGGQTGINDLQLGFKYLFIEGDGDKPAVIGEVSATLPTADYTKGLGLGASGLWAHWALEKKFESAAGYFGLGLGVFGENSDKIRQGSIFLYHIGASVPYKNKYKLHLEFKGYNHGNSRFNGVDNIDSYQEMYLAPGVNYFWTKKHTLSAALLFGLTSSSNNLGLILASTF